MFYNFSAVLEEMEMLTAFTSCLHVPNLSSPEHVLAVLEHAEIFSKGELQAIGKKMAGKKSVEINLVFPLLLLIFLFYISLFFRRVFIGIKTLLGLIDMTRQTEPQHRAIKFLSKMEEENFLGMSCKDQ